MHPCATPSSLWFYQPAIRHQSPTPGAMWRALMPHFWIPRHPTRATPRLAMSRCPMYVTFRPGTLCVGTAVRHARECAWISRGTKPTAARAGWCARLSTPTKVQPAESTLGRSCAFALVAWGLEIATSGAMEPETTPTDAKPSRTLQSIVVGVQFTAKGKLHTASTCVAFLS